MATRKKKDPLHIRIRRTCGRGPINPDGIARSFKVTRDEALSALTHLVDTGHALWTDNYRHAVQLVEPGAFSEGESADA